jgi:hypothetical protein
MTPEIAWLAGILEGEGNFTWHKTVRDKGRPRIQISMGDKDIIERVAKMFGANVCGPYGPYTTQKEPYWYTHCSADKAERWMKEVRPLMGARRQGRIDELLAKWAAL